jgi:hypothetical protein
MAHMFSQYLRRSFGAFAGQNCAAGIALDLASVTRIHRA